MKGFLPKQSYINIIIGEYKILDEIKIGKKIYCIAECSCGLKKEIRKDRIKYYLDLENSHPHCGCLYKNEYEINDFEVTGITYSGKRFLVDIEDYHRIKNYTWSFDGSYISSSKLNMRLHDYILKINGFEKNDLKVDRKNRNKLDNRKSNLRLSTDTESVRNRGLSHRNKSGILGVFMPKNRRMWESRITVNKKVLFLGNYENFEDAVIERLKAEKMYFGDFSPQKELFEEYGIE